MDQENVKQITDDNSIMVDDKKYVSISVPDWNMMAELVEKAKGKDRTMGKYAEDCGFSPGILAGERAKTVQTRF